MADQTPGEKLARLEERLKILKELLVEIRNDLKNQPTRDEVDRLDDKVDKLEKAQINLAIKIGIASGILGLLGGFFIKFIMS